jgi:hypothetical protein
LSFSSEILPYTRLCISLWDPLSRGKLTWTDDPNRDKNGFNANVGLIVAFDPISINVGVNSITKAVYLGLGFKTK